MAVRQTGGSRDTGKPQAAMTARGRQGSLATALLSLLGAGLLAAQLIPEVQPPMAAPAVDLEPQRQPQIDAAWDQAAMRFEPNRGQASAPVRYLARGDGYSLGLTAEGAWLSLRPRRPEAGQQAGPETPSQDAADSALLAMRLIGADPNAAIRPEQPQASRSHYLVGNDPAQWQRDLPNYGAVRYTAVYPGIDWVLYGNPQHLEYDLVVAPNADPAQIRLKFEGAENLALDADGHLAVTVNGATLLQHRPVSYQTVNGKRRPVDSRYVLDTRKQEIAFALGDYDHSLPLTIDPVLVYSTFLGGALPDGAEGVALDPAGNAYVVGRTASADFPTRKTIEGGNTSSRPLRIFVSKFSPSGALLYSTTIGGTGGDYGKAIVCDKRGNAYVVGSTASTNFPTVRARQSQLGGQFDAVVLGLSASGSSLMFSTYLGGSADDYGNAITLTPAGSVIVTGSTASTNFPAVAASQAALSGATDAFVAEFDSRAQLRYATYIGGSGAESGNAVTVDRNGGAVVAGSTASADFPVANAFQSESRDSGDGFVARFAPGAARRLWSSYLGGSGADVVNALTTDAAGNLVLAGQTTSVDFPVRSPLQEALRGRVSAFLTRMDVDGTRLLSSTYLGANGQTVAYAVALDSSGAIYLAGSTDGPGFPQVHPLDAFTASAHGIFVSKFAPDAAALRYSTIIGNNSSTDAYGIAVDSGGAAVVTGTTSDSGFPTVNALQPVRTDPFYRTDAFVTRIGYAPATLQFTAVQYEVGENGRNATITVERSGASEGAASVTYAATAGSAVAGTDFTPASGTLRWADGETGSQSFRVGIIDNGQRNADRSVNLALGTPSEFAQLGSRSTAVLMIADDETPVRINTDNDTLTEGNSGSKLMSFHARLERRAYRTVKVHYYTASGDGPGSATPGVDYDGVDGLFTFAPGETEKTFQVRVYGDTAVEPDETFTVNLDQCVGCELATTQGVGTIVNDDQLSAKPMISIGDASHAEGNSGSSTMRFTVALSQAASADVSVSVSSADGSATVADGDYLATRRTLTFKPGQTALAVNVTINGDRKAERNETFTLNLSQPVGAKIVDSQGVGTIVNDD